MISPNAEAAPELRGGPRESTSRSAEVTNVNQPDFEIRVARPENGPSRVLARIPGERIPAAAWTIHPLLSPDGKWVAVLLAEGAGTKN